jgi:hypothetical protein
VLVQLPVEQEKMLGNLGQTQNNKDYVGLALIPD